MSQSDLRKTALYGRGVYGEKIFGESYGEDRKSVV